MLRRSLLVLKKGGIVVSTLDELSKEDLEKYGVRASHVIVRSDSSQLEVIASLIDAGHVKPMVETVLPLSEARRAHVLSQDGHVRGKIVLKMKESGVILWEIVLDSLAGMTMDSSLAAVPY